jgi:hypothetical protein
MKKMSEAKKLKPGPTRKLRDSARKRNKKAANAKLNKMTFSPELYIVALKK